MLGYTAKTPRNISMKTVSGGKCLLLSPVCAELQVKESKERGPPHPPSLFYMHQPLQPPANHDSAAVSPQPIRSSFCLQVVSAVNGPDALQLKSVRPDELDVHTQPTPLFFLLATFSFCCERCSKMSSRSLKVSLNRTSPTKLCGRISSFSIDKLKRYIKM